MTCVRTSAGLLAHAPSLFLQKNPSLSVTLSVHRFRFSILENIYLLSASILALSAFFVDAELQHFAFFFGTFVLTSQTKKGMKLQRIYRLILIKRTHFRLITNILKVFVFTSILSSLLVR